MKEGADKFQGLNLYVKNLDDSINDDKLRELFSKFGTITLCKVMCDPNRVSKGSGFVVFSTADEASRALAAMNGKMVISKPLYVAVAQRKEERKASLEARFLQMRPMAMFPSVDPCIPMRPLGAPATGQQLYNEQVPRPACPPPPQAAGFGYRPQLMPGMRPGGAPMPNYSRPMGPQVQRPGGRHGPMGPAQQTQQPTTLNTQQRVFPRGRVAHPYPPAQLPPSNPLPAMAAALPSLTPEQQRMYFGETLYPMVDKLHHEYAAKVTGMLLELDHATLLQFIVSPQALKAKVEEAIEVLQDAAQNKTPTAADQLASLSLN